ncbi:MAG: hypothetical protein QOG69_1268, partial [Actinomycetota bacterium]|nr:hypothetical protein [Actinomycetota bacterium]
MPLGIPGGATRDANLSRSASQTAPGQSSWIPTYANDLGLFCDSGSSARPRDRFQRALRRGAMAMRVNPITRNRPALVQRGEDAALAAIVRSSHEAVIAKTVDGVITRWNEGARLVYGQTAGQMLGRSIESMIRPEDWPEERLRHARVAAGHAESGFRCCRLCVDGRAIEVVMSMSPMRNRLGEVIGVASISRPVSVREDADSRFASLMEAAPDATVCVDTAGYITMVNERVSSLFGYDRDELVGAPLDMLVPDDVQPDDVQPDDATHSADFALHLRARQTGAGSALQARRRDGSTFPVEVSLGTHGIGADVIVIAAIRDVTEERGLQAALQESETRLRQLADNVEHAFTLGQLDPPGYLYISPAFHTLTGLTPEEVMANPALSMDLVHPDDRARVERELFVPCGAGLAGRSEFRIIRGDGEVRWNRTFATPVPNPHGPPERMVSTTVDITERIAVAQALEAAEAAARAANDAKNAFLSRMSHEL